MGAGPLSSPLSASRTPNPSVSISEGSEVASDKVLFCFLEVCLHFDFQFCSQFCHYDSSMDSGLTK